MIMIWRRLRKYIDWQPFFIAWELHGKFPQILTDAKVGAEATKLYNDANALLDKIVNEKWLTAKELLVSGKRIRLHQILLK